MPSPTPAWLFDVYPHPRRSSLIVWVKHGSKTYRHTVPYRPDFCVRADAEPLETAEAAREECHRSQHDQHQSGNDGQIDALTGSHQNCRLHLGSEGIVSVLFDAEMSSFGFGPMMPVRLMVLDEELEDARRVLAS